MPFRTEELGAPRVLGIKVPVSLVKLLLAGLESESTICITAGSRGAYSLHSQIMMAAIGTCTKLPRIGESVFEAIRISFTSSYWEIFQLLRGPSSNLSSLAAPLSAPPSVTAVHRGQVVIEDISQSSARNGHGSVQFVLAASTMSVQNAR